MSRSCKKTPIIKDNRRGRRYFKRLANKRVRRESILVSGNYYKKVYNSWDIYDYVSYCSKEQYVEMVRKYGWQGNKEEVEQAWRRCYYNK